MSLPHAPAAICPVGAACLLLPSQRRAGDGGPWAACRPRAAVSLQACGGGGSGRAGAVQTCRRQGKEAGATLPYLTNGNVATVPTEDTGMEG